MKISKNISDQYCYIPTKWVVVCTYHKWEKNVRFSWGSAQKTRKNGVVKDKFDISSGLSYHQYAMQMYNTAQYLNAIITEKEIVSLAIHYPDKRIGQLIAIFNIDTR